MESFSSYSAIEHCTPLSSDGLDVLRREGPDSYENSEGTVMDRRLLAMPPGINHSFTGIGPALI